MNKGSVLPADGDLKDNCEMWDSNFVRGNRCWNDTVSRSDLNFSVRFLVQGMMTIYRFSRFSFKIFEWRISLCEDNRKIGSTVSFCKYVLQRKEKIGVRSVDRTFWFWPLRPKLAKEVNLTSKYVAIECMILMSHFYYPSKRWIPNKKSRILWQFLFIMTQD